MAEAVVVSTARTAIGTAFKGSLVDVDAFELGIARYAAIEAGLDHVAGVAHNRHCAAGLAAVTTAAAPIMAGMDRVVVAGGAHSSSTSPRATRRIPATTRRPSK